MLKTLLLVLALLSAQAVHTEAHRYFSAYADGEDSPATAFLSIHEHAGEMHWTLNVTDAGPGPIQATIEDGNSPASTLLVVALGEPIDGSSSSSDGTATASGVFNSAAIDAASGMSVDDLENHMGMGHVWLKLVTPEGAMYGLFEEANSAEGGEAGAMAAGSGDASSSMEMDMGMEMRGSADTDDSEFPVLPAVSAMEGEKEAGEDNSEHNHRRMLRNTAA